MTSVSNALPYYVVGGSEEILPVPVFDIQSRFHGKIQSYYPDNPVELVPLADVRNKLNNLVIMVRTVMPDVYFVSLSSLYYPNADAEISVTRIVDQNLNNLGIFARPGTVSLSEQISHVMKCAGVRPIFVIDDTLFHGQTIEHLIAEGLRVNGAIEYFTKIKAVNRLSTLGIEIYSVVSLEDYVDVMPVHDFLPGLPLCGKLLGLKNGSGVEPLTNGLSTSLPYLYPYVPQPTMAGWATIPESRAAEFSAFALTQMIVLTERLRNCGIYTLSDLAYAMHPHRVSIPHLRGIASHPEQDLQDIMASALYLAMT